MILDFIKDVFKPASDIVDELHFSGEEKGNIEIKKGELKNKLAEIEYKLASEVMQIESKMIEANNKLAISEQEHGNWLSKSWRPICSLACMGLLIAMGFNLISINETLMTICGTFLGIFVPMRSWEKKK